MVIEIDNLKKTFKDVKAVDDISFKVKKGELFSFLGVNGAGKSTTINIISGVLNKDSGKVKVCGYDIDEKVNEIKSKIGIVFQNSVLDKKLSVYDNLKYRANLYGIFGTAFKFRLEELSELLDIKDILKKYPYQLSGGQKQRVASARAIVTNPKLVLADEPTGALDSKNAKMLLESFSYLNTKRNTTILMVTHDAFTASYASRIIFIKDGKVFNEIRKGDQSRKSFFDQIIDVVTLLGGDFGDVI